ncbi:MAG: GC-type dockerin domain-anchored protein, partial [Phycisphaerales bacterium JB039]
RAAGSALRIDPGGFQSLRCGPVAGSLIRADAPLTCEAHVLRFPGSSALLWRSDRAASQAADGLLGAEQALELDSTRSVRTLATPDRAPDDRSLVLAGDWRGLVAVGEAAYVAAGPGAGAISIVAEIGYASGETTIGFEQPFGQTPALGSTLAFGPWSIQTVRLPFEPLGAGDERVWRGIRLDAADDGKAGVVAFAVSAYRDDVPGFMFGAAGWGGHGYDPQLDEAFGAATGAWMALSKADVWLQGFAQQGSTPQAMPRFSDAIRAALPGCEIVWVGETEHGNSTFEDWHRFVLNEGPAYGVPAISLLMEPSLGSFLEQLADGLRADNVHYSAFGNRILADLWTAQLDLATTDGACASVDLDGDGLLTLFDFLEFANLFAAGDLRADFDGSGALDVFDFFAYQNEFARCGG